MNFDKRKSGKVILVGAGPGDPGLLTVKGKEAIAFADCIIYDRLASPKLLSLAKEGCELIYVGKADHHHVVPQDKINELLVEKAKEYDLVVRLKGGDVYVFGRGGEEGIYLKEHGIEFEVIPGVTSAIAGLAAAGIPITHRGVATGFHVITAHGKEDRLTDIDFSKLTDEKETCVFLMGLKHVREVAQNLILAGRSEDTPAAVISHATTKEQKTCIGTLKDIGARVEQEKITSPAIIVVGNVVSLSSKLFVVPKEEEEATPLSGKTYVVPFIKNISGSKKSLAQSLREKGAEVLEIPVGEIRWLPFEMATQEIPEWLIFTSKNAVEGFFMGLAQNKIDMRAFGNTKIAAIGVHTAEKLEDYGVFADFLPSQSNGKTLGEEMAGVLKKDTSIWYIKGKEGGTEIAEAFCDNENYRERIVYENRAITYDKEAEQAICAQMKGADGIFFSSASCVRRICAIGRELPEKMYSIGPACTKQLMEYGFSNIEQAHKPSYEELIKLVQG
ncbi:MAG: uroporphyrinogen-III C-methyltransferase [Agathobacter sp.]